MRVVSDGARLTPGDGVALIEHFFQHSGWQGTCSRHIRFPQRNNRSTSSASLQAWLSPLLLGLGRIQTTEPLRHHGVFLYLAGLPGYPEATRWRRFLERFARWGRQALRQVQDRWRTARLGQPAR